MRQMETVKNKCFPLEQQRIAQLRIVWVQLHEEGLDVVWREHAW